MYVLNLLIVQKLNFRKLMIQLLLLHIRKEESFLIAVTLMILCFVTSVFMLNLSESCRVLIGFKDLFYFSN